MERLVKEGKGGDRGRGDIEDTPKHKTCLNGYSSGSPSPSPSPGRDLLGFYSDPFGTLWGKQKMALHSTAVCLQASCPPKFPKEV